MENLNSINNKLGIAKELFSNTKNINLKNFIKEYRGLVPKMRIYNVKPIFVF